MSNWWYVLAIVVIAVVVILVLRYRGRSGRLPLAPRMGIGPNRDYAQEREDARVSRMSEEDKTWEAASLERDREMQAEKKPPTDSS